MKGFIRRLLWKLTGKDCLVLNPAWSVLSSTEKHLLAGEREEEGRFLPVSYNYHFSRAWLLDYAIHGNGHGLLRYRLCVPENAPFCEVEMQVKLPFKWRVQLDENGLSGNGSAIPLKPAAAIPRDALWLVGDFEFLPSNGGSMVRRTGHRLRLDPGLAEEGYFQGLVYEDYERQVAGFLPNILQAITRHHPSQGRMLDIGCATGVLVKEALNRGLDATGVDFSSWAVGKANVLTGGRCRTLNMDEATEGDFDSAYDIITMHSVIEHLADPRRVLELLFKITSPGGIVYIQTLNADSLMSRMFKGHWEGFTDYTHKSPWLTARWLCDACSQAGFECVEINNRGVWNENIHDEVLTSFKSLVQMHPANVLFSEGFGDEVEIILRKPDENSFC